MKRSAMRNRLAALRTLVRQPRKAPVTEPIDIAQLLWSQLDTPLSLGLSLLAKNGQLEDLLRVEFNPGRYLESDTVLFANDSLALAFLKKCPLVIEGVDQEAAAWAKFVECEELCRQTNARFRHHREGASVPPVTSAILHVASRKISRWLGELSAESWALRCRFGPGVDRSCKGSRVSSYHKLSPCSSTEDFADGAAALVYSHPSWVRSLNGLSPDDHGPLPGFVDVEIVPGNKLVFVPKTALVHRSIAVEPRMNIYAQLGLGALLRQRLKRFAGLDLDTQEPSQALARLGSLNGTVATIDLSSASDTLSREVVRDLLPDPWFNAMDWCRSKVGFYERDGVVTPIRYEKFSSMGNGFTFELESMIFYAIALACAEVCQDDTSLVRCFGDDIAYPTRSVEQLEEVLTYCGFIVNRRKSFSSGLFRESCGADFFNGVNVRPIYLKEQLTYVESLFRLANSIRRLGYRRNRGYGCDEQLRRIWVSVVSRIPPSLRALKGPFRPLSPCGGLWADVESDDGYLACNLDEASSSVWVRRQPHSLEGWLYASAVAASRSEKAKDWAVLYAHALYTGRDGSAPYEVKDSPHDRDGDRLVPLRGAGMRQVASQQSCCEFFDVGPWV